MIRLLESGKQGVVAWFVFGGCVFCLFGCFVSLVFVLFQVWFWFEHPVPNTYGKNPYGEKKSLFTLFRDSLSPLDYSMFALFLASNLKL